MSGETNDRTDGVDNEDRERSFTLLRNVLRFSLSQIAFHQGLLPESSFTKSRFCGTDMVLVDAVRDDGAIRCEKGYRVSQWLEQGVFPVLAFVRCATVVVLRLGSSRSVTETFRFRVADFEPPPPTTTSSSSSSSSRADSSAGDARLLSEQIRSLVSALVGAASSARRRSNDDDDDDDKTALSVVLEYAPNAPDDVVSSELFSDPHHENPLADGDDGPAKPKRASSSSSRRRDGEPPRRDRGFRSGRRGRRRRRRSDQRRRATKDRDDDDDDDDDEAVRDETVVRLGAFSTKVHTVTLVYRRRVRTTSSETASGIESRLTRALESAAAAAAATRPSSPATKSPAPSSSNTPPAAAARTPPSSRSPTTAKPSSATFVASTLQKRRRLRIAPFTPTPPGARNRATRCVLRDDDDDDDENENENDPRTTVDVRRTTPGPRDARATTIAANHDNKETSPCVSEVPTVVVSSCGGGGGGTATGGGLTFRTTASSCFVTPPPTTPSRARASATEKSDRTE